MTNSLYRNSERGAVTGSLIAIILLSIAVIGCIGLAIWLFIQYSAERNTVQSQVKVAVAEAVRETSEKEQQKFLEREKEPNRLFAGPDDYGRLTFSYSKQWSVYVADNGSSGTYKAYLHPVTVPSVEDDKSRFALRVEISNEQLDSVLSTYEGQIETGDLKSSAVSVNGHRGTRLDGKFSEDIRGAAVFFKLRDKTIALFTDAETFKPDYDKLIKTVDFND